MTHATNHWEQLDNGRHVLRGPQSCDEDPILALVDTHGGISWRISAPFEVLLPMASRIAGSSGTISGAKAAARASFDEALRRNAKLTRNTAPWASDQEDFYADL